MTTASLTFAAVGREGGFMDSIRREIDNIMFTVTGIVETVGVAALPVIAAALILGCFNDIRNAGVKA
ncbi:hypothetical protein ACFRAQ_34595 [Nocardia sp. NPDC056611]|uniref:hypothetical protein n=1 Tax=Nocardia sp. NPDC056611 TaxID=3345877 RepID=UPI003671CB0C